MRWLFKFILGLVLLIALIVWSSNFWSFWLVKGYLMHRGYGCTAERFELGFWPPRLEIDDLVIRNPEDFPDLRGVRVSHFKLVVPYKTLLGQGHRIAEADIEIPELVIVRAESGELNWARLTPPKAGARPERPVPGGEKPPGPPPVKSPKRAQSSAFYGVKMDRLRLKLGAVEFRDYRVAEGAPPKVITTDLQVDRTYQPVPNLPLVLVGLGLEISMKAGPELKQIMEQAKAGRGEL